MSRRDLINAFADKAKGTILGYVETSGGGAWTIDASQNVSSITDNGTGDFTVNWTVPFLTATYVAFATPSGSTVTNGLRGQQTTGTAQSTSLVRMVIYATNGSAGVLTDPTEGVNVIAAQRI